VDWTPVEAVLDRRVVIEADAVQLRRLLVNLLANARRAAGTRGLVRVCVGTQLRYAVLEVHDSGTGTPTAERSTGLGLLIATGIAERHGGWIESGPSDLGGVRVRVLIPLGGAEGMA
jgi:signal transduction histidine kinase